jgi:hypothetical protein
MEVVKSSSLADSLGLNDGVSWKIISAQNCTTILMDSLVSLSRHVSLRIVPLMCRRNLNMGQSTVEKQLAPYSRKRYMPSKKKIYTWTHSFFLKKINGSNALQLNFPPTPS